MSEWRLKLYRGKYAAVRSVDGATERFSLRTPDLLEAKRRLADHIAKPVGELVADIVEAYLADKRKTAIRWKDLEGSWKQAKPTFGHLRPDQITRDLCRAERRDGVSGRPSEPPSSSLPNRRKPEACKKCTDRG